MLKWLGSSNIKKYVAAFLESEADWLRGKAVVDIPAGSGYTAGIAHRLGADVRAYDLFPEFFEAEGLECRPADLTQALPVESASADLVICQEGIEHLPDQLAVLREFARILRPGGRLILTTPNVSHLRARVSHLLTESDFYKRMPPNELDALWFAGDGRMYFGHLFLINAQKLRVLAAVAGFRLRRILPVRASFGSLLLAWLYPLIALASLYAYARNVYRRDEFDPAAKRRLFREMIRLNLHPNTLFGKHIFWELEKTDEARLRVHRSSRDII